MRNMYKIHTDIRVAFEDVDAFKIVHNSKYFCYFERGRLEYLRELGLVNDGPESFKNIEVAIAENYCSYKKPALFDDLITVSLRISFMKNSSFQFQYVLTRKADNSILAVGYTNLVYIDKETMKPKAILSEVKEAVARFEGEYLGKEIGVPKF